MRSKILTFCLALPALALVGCGKPVAGKVSLTGDRPIVLNNKNGQPTELKAGAASVQVTGFFSPSLEITTPSEKIEVALPSRLGFDDFNFYVNGSEINQSVDFEAKVVSKPIGNRIEEGYDACFTPGYCDYYGNYPYPGPGYPNSPYPGPYPGHPYPGHPNYGWRPDCPGSMLVRRTYEMDQETYYMGFRDAKSTHRELLGFFEGDRGVVSNLVKSEPLGECFPN